MRADRTGRQERSNFDLGLAFFAAFMIVLEVMTGLTPWGSGDFDPTLIPLALLLMIQSWRLYKSPPDEESKDPGFTGRWTHP